MCWRYWCVLPPRGQMAKKLSRIYIEPCEICLTVGSAVKNFKNEWKRKKSKDQRLKMSVLSSIKKTKKCWTKNLLYERGKFLIFHALYLTIFNKYSSQNLSIKVEKMFKILTIYKVKWHLHSSVFFWPLKSSSFIYVGS